MMQGWLERLKNESPSQWSEGARKWAEDSGLIKGDQQGNLQYHSLVTREHLVVFSNVWPNSPACNLKATHLQYHVTREDRPWRSSLFICCPYLQANMAFLLLHALFLMIYAKNLPCYLCYLPPVSKLFFLF